MLMTLETSRSDVSDWVGGWLGAWVDLGRLGAWVGLDADDFGDVQVGCIRLGRGLAWSMGRLG